MNQERRDFFTKFLAVGVGGAVSGALIPNAFLSSVAMAAKKEDKKSDKKSSPKQIRAEAAAALAKCILDGEACVAHCAIEFEDGNKEMAKCNKSVHDMLAMTKAMLSLVSANSPLYKKVASICADACKTCIEACEEHKPHFAHGMHLECKACMESCIKCEKICRKLAE